MAWGAGITGWPPFPCRTLVACLLLSLSLSLCLCLIQQALPSANRAHQATFAANGCPEHCPICVAARAVSFWCVGDQRYVNSVLVFLSFGCHSQGSLHLPLVPGVQWVMR